MFLFIKYKIVFYMISLSSTHNHTYNFHFLLPLEFIDQNTATLVAKVSVCFFVLISVSLPTEKDKAGHISPDKWNAMNKFLIRCRKLSLLAIASYTIVIELSFVEVLDVNFV